MDTPSSQVPVADEPLYRVKSTRMKDKWALHTTKGFLAFFSDRIEFTPRRGRDAPLVISHSEIESWQPSLNYGGSLLVRLVLTVRDLGELRFAFAFKRADKFLPGLEVLPEAARLEAQHWDRRRR